MGVHTGEELAKFLAIEGHRDAFKEVHGVRPRHMDYDNMSIDDIESRSEELWKQAAHEEDEDYVIPWDEREELGNFLQHQQDELSNPPKDEFDVDYDKYADVEEEWDEKNSRRR